MEFQEIICEFLELCISVFFIVFWVLWRRLDVMLAFGTAHLHQALGAGFPRSHPLDLTLVLGHDDDLFITLSL